MLRGYGGNDTLLGGRGNDRFDGGTEGDLMVGGDGDDGFFLTLSGTLSTLASDRDTIYGGLGNDTLYYSTTSAQMTAAVKAEFVRLDNYLAAADFSAAFVSSILRLELHDVDGAMVRLDGAVKTVADVLAPMVAGADAYAGTEDAVLSVTAAQGLLANDASEAGGLSVLADTIVTARGGSVLLQANGAFTYTPAADVNGTDSFSYTLRDSVGRTATGSVTLALAAAADAARITGTATGSVTEDAGIVASGQLTVIDPDAGEARLAEAGTLFARYGSFSIDQASGGWSYILSNGLAAVQGLGAGQTVTDAITLHSLDGSASQAITVTIAGSNDHAVADNAYGAVAEDGSTAAAGTLFVYDGDAGEAGFQPPASLLGDYGSFTFDPATNAWTYALDNAAAQVQGLTGSDTRTDSLVLTSLDGTATSTILVTIQGAPDAARITGDLAAAVTEDGTTAAAGRIAVLDPDRGEDHADPARFNWQMGSYGSFTFDRATGSWGYALDNASALVQRLAAGEVATDTLDLHSQDGSAHATVTVSITGANDAAHLSGDTARTITEDGPQIVYGQLLNDDPDHGDSGFQPPAGSGRYGSFSIDATGFWSYLLTPSLVQSLVAGEQVTDGFLVASADGTGTAAVTITIQGADDPASIDGTATGTVAEDGTLTAGGQLLVHDPDQGQAGFRDPASLAGDYGSFGFDAATGAWSYTLDNASAAVQALAAGQQVADRLTVLSADGTARQEIVVTIDGAADGPIAGPAAASIAGLAARGDGFKITGTAPFDLAGGSVAAIADRNGDGLAEILVGVPGLDTPAGDSGGAFVVYGTARGSDLSLGALGGALGFRLDGMADGDNAGAPIRAAGDVNGDGLPDIALGATHHDVSVHGAYAFFDPDPAIWSSPTTTLPPMPAPSRSISAAMPPGRCRWGRPAATAT
ncbi:VCBS domain-containing protein [Dankookia sp. P2]|uniref:VCBS domain-containing protein n=1 Tax=Dankookia sp. P2 TaxID=3423955 RepID=UPI003D6773B4